MQSISQEAHDVKIFDTIADIRQELDGERLKRKSIGFVPTMGALHEGHQSLIERSILENDITVVSIFVNPLQFGADEDFATYPKTFDSDLQILKRARADMVFVPRVSEIYPDGFSTFVDMTGLTEVLCGKHRDGHFRGVMTVVTKLLNIIAPTRAYFGEKDAQQLAIVRKMVRDMNMNIDIVACKTARESDGLAISSRNVNLSPQGRKAASCLYMALKAAKEILDTSRFTIEDAKEDIDISRTTIDEANMSELISSMLNRATLIINSEPLVKLEYVDILDAKTLSPLTAESENALLAVAAFVDNVRLIDNISFKWA